MIKYMFIIWVSKINWWNYQSCSENIRYEVSYKIFRLAGDFLIF